jgi:hypothetical protein
VDASRAGRGLRGARASAVDGGGHGGEPMMRERPGAVTPPCDGDGRAGRGGGPWAMGFWGAFAPCGCDSVTLWPSADAEPWL